MEDVIRERVQGANFKPLQFTLKNGDGVRENLSDLADVSTDVTLQFQEIDTSDQLIGAAFAGVGMFAFLTQSFNALNDVQDATDEIELLGHQFQTGDAVVYSNGGGTDIAGLTDGVTYFARRVDATAVTLFATKQDAIGNVSKLAIVPGLNQSHSLTSNGDNGVVTYPLQTSDLATIRDLQALVTVDFGSTQLEKYPTGYRYILRVIPPFAQAD